MSTELLFAESAVDSITREQVLPLVAHAFLIVDTTDNLLSELESNLSEENMPSFEELISIISAQTQVLEELATVVAIQNAVTIQENEVMTAAVHEAITSLAEHNQEHLS